MLSTFPSPMELQGTVQGTMLYLGLYMGFFVPLQSFSKFYLLAQHKKEDKKASLREVKYYSRDKIALMGDRTAGNFVEFAIVFLPLLWMHALFVDPTQSWSLSLCYTAFRAPYPLLFSKGLPYLFLSTVPNYLVIMYMTASLIKNVCF